MLKKIVLASALAMTCLPFVAKAQADFQLYYDFGSDRQYVSTTFELFKADQYGDTFIFVDHYFSNKDNREAGLYSAINGSYFEIERAINFWQDTKLGALSAHIEYDGSSWGASILCLGAKYAFHNADFSNTFSLALMYDQHIGVGSAKVPVKFSGVWGMQDLFGVTGLRFSGFADFWWENHTVCPVNKDGERKWAEGKTSNVVFITEPQLWYAVGQHFGVDNLNVGTEIELSYDFGSAKGFWCRPCLGVKWVF